MTLWNGHKWEIVGGSVVCLKCGTTKGSNAEARKCRGMSWARPKSGRTARKGSL